MTTSAVIPQLDGAIGASVKRRRPEPPLPSGVLAPVPQPRILGPDDWPADHPAPPGALRCPNGAYAQIEEWSPEFMFYMLTERNPYNRPLKPNNIARIAADMAAGLFMFNGATAVIDEDGNLLDVQHRGHAQVDTNTTQVYLVVRNVPREAQKTMDRGAKRNLADNLALSGEKTASTRQAALRHIYAYQRTGIPLGGMVRPGPSDVQLQNEVWPQHAAGLRASAEEFRYAINDVPRSTIVALHYLFSSADPEEATEFFRKFDSGAGLAENDPILVVRKRISDERKLGGRGINHQRLETGFVIRAWNGWRTGETFKKIQRPVNFPTIHGCKIPIIGSEP